MLNISDPTLELAKALSYFGLLLLVGAAVFPAWIGREMYSRKNPALAAWTGFALLVGSSFYSIWVAVTQLGDASLFATYLFQSNAGSAIASRAVLGAFLVILALFRFKFEGLIKSLVALGLTATFSLSSHAEAEGSALALSDWIHISSAVLWASSLLFLFFNWNRSKWEQRRTVLARFSTLSLGLVILLAVAGSVVALVQVHGFGNLIHSRYGQLLLAKIVLFILALGCAAYGRFIHLPGLQKKTSKNAGLLGLEGGLILAIVALSGALSSTPPPSGPFVQTNSITISTKLTNYSFIGKLYSEASEAHLELDIRDQNGKAIGGFPPLSFEFESENGEKVIRPVLPFFQSQYHSTVPLSPGIWKVNISVLKQDLKFTLRVPPR